MIKKGIIFFFGIVFSILLVGCTLPAGLSELKDKIITGDKKHSVEQEASVLMERYYPQSGRLDLSGLGLEDIPDICDILDSEFVGNIKSLDLSSNNISAIEGQNISCLKNLIDIDLSHNNIESLVGFPIFESLEKLTASYNKIKNLDGISGIKELLELDIAHNLIESLVGVENLSSLTKLYAEYNKLKDVDALKQLQQLENLGISLEGLQQETKKRLNLLTNVNE